MTMPTNHFIHTLLCRSSGAADCNGIRPLRRWLIGASALLLAACASPGSVAPGTPVAQVVASLGQPTATYALADGGKRYFYPGGGLDEQAWMLDFDREGRLVSRRQVHSEAAFAQVQVGKDTQASVQKLLGPAAWTDTLGPSKSTGWAYPYLPTVGGPAVMMVIFDAQGVVQSMQGGPDARIAGGGSK